MIIKFNVTQEDIDKGCQIDRKACMVARCISRTLQHKDLECYTTYLNIEFQGDKFEMIEFTQKVTDNIGNFDMGLIVKPFSFSLDIPDSVLEQIGYFDKKGTTTVDDYTNKENNIEDKINHDGHQVVKACQD